MVTVTDVATGLEWSSIFMSVNDLVSMSLVSYHYFIVVQIIFFHFLWCRTSSVALACMPRLAIEQLDKTYE